MEEVILSFGVVTLLVVDADIRFWGAFEEKCNFLRITFCNLARGNNKGNSVENYHWVLYKTQDIAKQDHGRHEVFFQNVKTSQYV